MFTRGWSEVGQRPLLAVGRDGRVYVHHDHADIYMLQASVLTEEERANSGPHRHSAPYPREQTVVRAYVQRSSVPCHVLE